MEKEPEEEKFDTWDKVCVITLIAVLALPFGVILWLAVGELIGLWHLDWQGII